MGHDQEWDLASAAVAMCAVWCRADQILVMESGRIVEEGSHDWLLERKGHYYDLYTYQARI
jgi:ABC-type multidrug transport system fused ATPase/permease subunit